MNECFFDGRLIGVVLDDIGFSLMNRHIMYLNAYPDGTASVMFKGRIPCKMNVIRVVTNAPTFSHSSLVFVRENKCWWFNPRVNNEASATANSYMKVFVTEELRRLTGMSNMTVTDLCAFVNEKKMRGCSASGYCNAYVLKYLVDWYNGVEFDSSDIRGFANKMRDQYEDLLNHNDPPDVQYGIDTGGALTGGIIGGALGGLVGGGPGLLLGGTAGAVIGGTKPTHHSRSDSKEIISSWA